MNDELYATFVGAEKIVLLYLEALNNAIKGSRSGSSFKGMGDAPNPSSLRTRSGLILTTLMNDRCISSIITPWGEWTLYRPTSDKLIVRSNPNEMLFAAASHVLQEIRVQRMVPAPEISEEDPREKQQTQYLEVLEIPGLTLPFPEFDTRHPKEFHQSSARWREMSARQEEENKRSQPASKKAQPKRWWQIW